MKQTMNLTATKEDLNRFADRADLQAFYKEKGLDGLELMLCGAHTLPEKVTPREVIGIHLKYFPSWLDFWKGNTEALDREYDNRETWEMFYGAKNREEFLSGWREELEIAHETGVQYVVFHVSECTLEECLTYVPLHSDEEVCDAACEIINELLDGRPYQFCFLVENLWWSGLTMTRPDITRRLMDGIHYAHKGIILDTGHLLHTNNRLRTQEEGVEYIHQILDLNGDLCRYIKGVHLNQSMTGAYVEESLRHPMTLHGSYWDRLAQLYPHIFNIDNHRPFTADGVAALLRRIQPEFVTHEMISCDRQELDNALNAQVGGIRRNGGLV